MALQTAVTEEQLQQDWQWNWRTVGTKVTELNEELQFPWADQLWFASVQDATIEPKLTTVQTLQVLENLKITHQSGVYGQQGEGIQFPTSWALARIRELGEDELVRKLNAEWTSNRRAETMTAQQAENLAERLREADATQEDFDQMQQAAAARLQAQVAAAEDPEEVQQQLEAAVQDLAKILLEDADAKDAEGVGGLPTTGEASGSGGADLGDNAATGNELSQTLPGLDLVRTRQTIQTTYWTTGKWSGKKNKMEIWIKQATDADRTTAMLGLPRLRRPITEGERLLDQGSGLHTTLVYLEPSISPPQLLEDALSFQMEAYLKSFPDQNITLAFDPSDCEDMLLIRQSEEVNSVFVLVHTLRCWILRYSELRWHIKNYVPGRQAWHYVAEAVQHQRRAVLTGIHMSIKGVGMKDEDDERSPGAARKGSLQKAAKAEAAGSKLFAGTSLHAGPRKLQRSQVRSRSC